MLPDVPGFIGSNLVDRLLASGSVYGEAPVVPTPEDGPFPIQTSLYGASNAAGEGQFAAYCEVNDSIGWICEELGVKPKLEYSGGDRDWIGDNPFIFLDTTRIQSLGWKPKFGICDEVVNTVKYLQKNEWVFKTRL